MNGAGNGPQRYYTVEKGVFHMGGDSGGLAAAETSAELCTLKLPEKRKAMKNDTVKGNDGVEGSQSRLHLMDSLIAVVLLAPHMY
jgi:hypothetical protein